MKSVRLVRVEAGSSLAGRPFASRQKGFTVIEIILVLLILGMLSVFVLSGLGSVMQGFTFYKGATDVSRNSQLAMGRIIKDFSYIETIASGSIAAIQYTATFPPFTTVSANTLSYDAETDRLTLNGHVLADNLGSFQLQYCHFDPVTGNEVCAGSHGGQTSHIAISMTMTKNGVGKTLQTKVSIP